MCPNGCVVKAGQEQIDDDKEATGKNGKDGEWDSVHEVMEALQVAPAEGIEWARQTE
jgi:hypothetical protein